MINQYFDIVQLDPVKYQIAQVSVVNGARRKAEAYRRRGHTVKSGRAFSSFYKYCLIALMLLIIFTAVNIIGFGDFLENLKQVAGGISFYSDPDFV
jgi:hypothetical protein